MIAASGRASRDDVFAGRCASQTAPATASVRTATVASAASTASEPAGKYDGP